MALGQEVCLLLKLSRVSVSHAAHRATQLHPPGSAKTVKSRATIGRQWPRPTGSRTPQHFCGANSQARAPNVATATTGNTHGVAWTPGTAAA